MHTIQSKKITKTVAKVVNDLFKISKKIYRAEGGIEPLGYYASTDLKSAHRTIEDHPRTLTVKNFVYNSNLYHGNQMWPFDRRKRKQYNKKKVRVSHYLTHCALILLP